MYSLHCKKNGIYANICLFRSYSVSQSVSGSDGGSAPGDDFCGPGHRWRRDTWMSPGDISPGNTSTKNTIKLKLHNIIIVRNCNNIKIFCGFCLARGEMAPQLSLVSPKFFFSLFCHRGSFGSLPLSVLAKFYGK